MMFWFWICAFFTRVCVWFADTPWKDVGFAVAFLLLALFSRYAGVPVFFWFDLGLAALVLVLAPRPSYSDDDDDQESGE